MQARDQDANFGGLTVDGQSNDAQTSTARSKGSKLRVQNLDGQEIKGGRAAVRGQSAPAFWSGLLSSGGSAGIYLTATNS